MPATSSRPWRLSPSWSCFGTATGATRPSRYREGISDRADRLDAATHRPLLMARADDPLIVVRCAPSLVLRVCRPAGYRRHVEGRGSQRATHRNPIATG